MEKVPDVSWSYQKDYSVVAECGSDYPSIYFMFDGKWIEVNQHDYLLELEDGLMCTLLIKPIQLSINTLGMPIYLDYYTIHDPVTGKITVGPHTGSEKESIKSGEVPPANQFLEVRVLP